MTTRARQSTRSGRRRNRLLPAALPLLPSASDVGTLRRRLLRWYDDVRRPLPWRREVSLYGTWVAEIMLQQTTVAVAAPYWERFVSLFPSVHALAAAPEQDVLAAWSGLGYYRRARDLQAAAREVASRPGATLPTSAEQWRALPGIGAYTAGAIASIALGEVVPAVDGNARRVLLRLLCKEAAQAAQLSGAALEQAVAAALVDPTRPGDWNQALMELGALVCLPETPRCGVCPVAQLCQAHAARATSAIPPARPRPAARAVALSLLVLRRGSAVLLEAPGASPRVCIPGAGEPARKDFSALHRGLWGLPGTPWYELLGSDVGEGGGGGSDPTVISTWREWLASWSACASAGATFSLVDAGRFSHAITKYRLTVRVVRGEVSLRAAAPGPAAWWELSSPMPPLSALARKALVRAGVEWAHRRA